MHLQGMGTKIRNIRYPWWQPWWNPDGNPYGRHCRHCTNECAMAAECECGVSKFDQLSMEDSHKMIFTHSSPIVLGNMIHEWTSREWTVSFLCKTHPSKLTKLRICKKKVTRPKVDEGPIMETDCKYVNATLKEMLMWLEDNVHPDNPWKEYARCVLLQVFL